MKSLKRMSTILLVLGSVFVILGLLQSLPLEAVKYAGYVYDELYLNRSIRSFVFLTTGGFSLVVGYLVKKVNDEVREEYPFIKK
ncbi:hypothetical protein H1D32_12040 [Anaerobacillus sp. CMMVII]|uniref:hypothetical protein n=1 Tax=Anaerobacillus sp. CMMVII TaxID=2755588 RepID=UPI0021B72FB1|nr:hypothetical protein [Anaerobacillus sp. CMMVII]MCT8138412.1 hypothetical protein [Anaerobacillus sp. CMMVII]